MTSLWSSNCEAEQMPVLRLTSFVLCIKEEVPERLSIPLGVSAMTIVAKFGYRPGVSCGREGERKNLGESYRIYFEKPVTFRDRP